MNAMTQRYIEGYKRFDGTIDDYIREIPDEDISGVNMTQLRTHCRKWDIMSV